MTKMKKQLKLMAIVSAFAVFMAAASVVYGGLSWTGIDPIITLSDGSEVHVDIGVPPGQWCKVDSPIQVTVTVPPGILSVVEQDGPCGVTTETTVVVGSVGEIGVSATVNTTKGKAKFRIEIMISHEGQELNTCSGKANGTVECAAELGN